jgi:hypothetical protein
MRRGREAKTFLLLNVSSSDLQVIVFAGSELRLTAAGTTQVGWRAANASATSAVAITPYNGPSVELVDTQSLFARLVWHQVRSGNQPAVAETKSQNQSSHDQKSDVPSFAVAVIGPPIAFRSAKRVTGADRRSSDPPTTPIETLFCELACRRLRKLAIEEKP